VDVWIVVGFTGQVYGAYTTERKALVRYEELNRSGVPVQEPVHSTLNKEKDDVIQNDE
jgi:hypothetical protein